MSELQSVPDLNEGAWIKKNTLSLESPMNKGGNFVEHCIPAKFPSYCKIFHNIYEDESIKDHTVTWDYIHKHQPVDLNDPVQKALGAVTRLYGGTDPLGQGNLTRIRWAALAERYDLKFHADINVDSFSRNFPTTSWPRYLTGPEEGSLEGSTCKEIIRSIGIATADFELSRDYFFLYDVIATMKYERDLLFEGPLRSAFETYKLEGVNGTPTYWWPKDRSLLLCTDWDLVFTLVGGTEEVIESLISNPELECVAVNPKNRIDYKSDTINP